MSSDKPLHSVPGEGFRSFNPGDMVGGTRGAFLAELAQDPELVAFYELWTLGKTDSVDEPSQGELRTVTPQDFEYGFAFKWDLNLAEAQRVRDECLKKIEEKTRNSHG